MVEKDNEYEYTTGVNSAEQIVERREVSIIDNAGLLSVSNFEQAIACGSSREDLCVIFNKTDCEMNKWCLNNYGLHFDEAYNRILRMMKNKFVSALSILAERGNASAINICAAFLTHYADNSAGAGVNIINNVPGGVVVEGKEKDGKQD